MIDLKARLTNWPWLRAKRASDVEPEVASGLSQPRRAIAIAAVLAAMTLVVLDAAIANIALPTIARALEVTPAMSVLVVTAYQMALVMALLPCAALGECLGYRRVFIIGVAIFTAASGMCALSPSLPWLVAARFIQGLGGACVMSLGVALLRFSVPKTQLGAAIGWNALTVALSSAAGPTIGAAILTGQSWPWLFAINIPLGVTVLFAARALPATRGSARPLDVISAALNAGAFAALIIGAEWLPSRPLAGVFLLATGALCLFKLVHREVHRPSPLIPLDLLRGRSFRISVFASICCFAGQTTGMVALPFYLQHGLGLQTMMAGLYMTPWPLSVAVTAPAAGWLSSRIPTGWLCVVGAGCLASGLAMAALCPLEGRAQLIVPMVMLCGLGFGLFQTPNNRSMFLSAPLERSGAAGGMQGTARLIGQTVGALVMTFLFSLTSQMQAPRIGLAIGAGWALAACIISSLHFAGRGDAATSRAD